jgi:hypothetical protein
VGEEKMNNLIGKTVKTKGGINVRIIAFEDCLEQPIIGILEHAYGDDLHSLEQWHSDGKYVYWENRLLDLVLE